MKNRLFSFVLLLTIAVYGIVGYHFLTGWHPLAMMLLSMTIGVVLNVIVYWLFTFIAKRSKKLPITAITAVLSGITVFVGIKIFGFGWPNIFYYPAIALCLLFCVGVAWFLNKKSLLTGLFMGIPFIGILLLFFKLTTSGDDPYIKETPSAFLENTVSFEDNLSDNPAAKGPFTVSTFTYGSGSDVHRDEYASGIKFKTESVNAKAILPEWKGKKKKWREQYWEFGVENFPLNGRVYMPEGDGPFPLTLIVHGNHSMIDYSDDGYGYLGELLASKGIIAVSVDQNFINGHWSGDFMGKEMPARAWLLLKHLQVWRKWNSQADHDLAQKVDMSNIMLVGHSRGGEAVSIAAAFNELPYFPDDTNEKFDFNFNIKGVVALAPTDYRYDRKIKLKNINFLSLQGSYDADEVSFWGMRPYRRLEFTDSISHFKAGVYIHHANHGQFNSTWGKSDFGAPTKWLLNLDPLLSEEEQQATAKVFISAFAEATLKNNKGYLPLFKNVATGKKWLPIEHYLTHFEASNTTIIANFEEDLNVTRAGDSTFLIAKNMKIWKEQNLKTRDNESQENNALFLGWDVKADSNVTPVYEIRLNRTQKELFSTTATLNLSIAAGSHEWLANADEKNAKNNNEGEKREIPQLDFTIQLTDSAGARAVLKVSGNKKIPKPLKTRFTKFEFLEEDMVGADWEVQLQSYHFPLKQFQAQNPDFAPTQISKIEFLFDQNQYGVVVLDDISVSK
jgi:dienelactone hydrolase